VFRNYRDWDLIPAALLARGLGEKVLVHLRITVQTPWLKRLGSLSSATGNRLK